MKAREKKAAVIAAIISFGLLILGLAAPKPVITRAALTVAYHFALGWLLYPARVLPKVAAHGPGVLTALICLLLFGLGLHSFMKWLYAGFDAKVLATGSSPRQWRFRWSMAIVAMVGLLFAAGICIVVTTHQISWLLGDKDPLIKIERKRIETPG